VTRGLLVAAALMVAAGCGANAPTYAGCGDDLDCGRAEDRCTRVLFTRSDGTEGDGALCTPACASDADCPEGGACVALEGDPTETFFCASRCAASADCYAGFACTEVEGADRTMRLCLP